MENTIKNFEEYFNVNESAFEKKEKTPLYKNGGDEGEMEIESEDEIYASKLGLKGCKIIGVSKTYGGIKLAIKDSSSYLGWCDITVKNGKVDIHTEFHKGEWEEEEDD